MKSKIGKTLVLLIFAYLIFVLSSGLWQLYKAGGRLEEVRSNLESEKKRNDELKSRLSEVESQSFVEKEAREKLNMQLSGEVVVILPEMNVNLDSESKDIEKQVSNWQKWWNLFR